MVGQHDGVPRFLSDEWLAAAETAAAAADVPDGLALTVQHRVTGTPDGDVAYAVRLAGGKAEVIRGAVDDPDVTFTQSWDTAVAVHRGEVTAQDAFMTGRMRVDGDVRVLLREGERLAALDGLLADVRPETTY